ncbi:MAG: hypothetical protein ACKV19_15120 [Verrucomicrobiales bacterium]
MSNLDHQRTPGSFNVEPKLETEWVRLPLPGQRLEGLGRSYLYELITQGRIRSYALKKRGAVRGIRLIHLPSLREYIENSALLNP